MNYHMDSNTATTNTEQDKSKMDETAESAASKNPVSIPDQAPASEPDSVSNSQKLPDPTLAEPRDEGIIFWVKTFILIMIGLRSILELVYIFSDYTSISGDFTIESQFPNRKIIEIMVKSLLAGFSLSIIVIWGIVMIHSLIRELLTLILGGCIVESIHVGLYIYFMVVDLSREPISIWKIITLSLMKIMTLIILILLVLLSSMIKRKRKRLRSELGLYFGSSTIRSDTSLTLSDT